MTDVATLKGIGETTAKLLHKVGLDSCEDIVENIPRKYDDYSVITEIRNLKPGPVTIRARLSSVQKRYSKKGLHITEALASDETGSVRITWFNQPYRASSLKVDEEYFLSGEFAQNFRYFAITNPASELVSSFPLHTARLVPQYRLTKGLTAHTLCKITKQSFEKITINETLPSWLTEKHSLMDRRSALLLMHFPETMEQMEKAKRRLAFEELFQITLASELNKQDFQQLKGLRVPLSERDVVNFVSSLPFTLTENQRVESWRILQDMQKSNPMNRLLEGDVGSGKTVVAAIATVNVASNGMQTALMAPTQLLANQHYATLQKLLPESLKDQVVLSTSTTKKSSSSGMEKLASGEALIAVGTHALLQDDVHFKKLGLVIVDEQHRFGVEQRKKLQTKAKVMPHVLHMSATPIPRSLMLTLFGELDVSILAEKPANRKDISTIVTIPENRLQLYASLQTELKAGRQVYVVCPQIIEGEQKVERTLSVEKIHEQVAGWLKPWKVEMLHGKMKPQEKDEVMDRFVKNETQVLVSTTVIEVGVDVPNATVMLIEGADRFGLAQLHQLRGRVGRGEHESVCYLISTTNDSVPKRLKLLSTENDGFTLAEYDLEERGPGAIYGTIQHGVLDLRVAKITDVQLIKLAREAAREFMKKGENLVQYTQLKARVDRLRTITNLN